MAFIKKYNLHYAWIVLVAAMVLNVVSRADQSSFGVFIDPLVDQFGWKRGDISFAYSLAFLIGLPAVALMGWAGDRYGARQLMVIASLFIGVGTVLLGTVKELWQFYLYYSLFVGSVGHAAFSVLLPVIMTRWFHRHMGVTLGLYWAAQGLGPVIFAPLFRWQIETQGWQNAFQTIGIVMGVILVVFSLFIFNAPKDKGLKPYGAEDIPEPQAGAAKAARPPVKVREILRQRIVWQLAGSIMSVASRTR
ncbi:MAG: MFS transporter [Betaproteobacteria bacterium]|nr:MFS transporter [Betaproteobacteria bacterium]